MSKTQDISKALRVPAVLVPIVATVVVILLWLVLFYSPESSKLSKLNAQQQTAETTQAKLQAELISLEKLKSSGLTALQARYGALVPPTIDNTGYLKLINSAVTEAGATLLSFTPGAATSGSAASSSGVTPIPISLNTSGTFDQEIKLMQLIYQLPRLTVIDGVTIGGGGPATNRSSVLTVSYSMTIFDTAAPTSAPRQ